MIHGEAGEGRRPRVLWISHLVPYPPKAGVVMRSYYLLRALAERYEVDLFCLNQAGFLKSLLPGIEDPCAFATAELQKTVGRIRVCEKPTASNAVFKYLAAFKALFSRTPYSVSWLYSREVGRQLESFAKGRNYDLVHVDTEALIPYLSSVKFARRLALNHHNAEAHMMNRRAEKEASPLRKMYCKIEAKKLFRYARESFGVFDLHLTCSEEDRHRILEIDKGFSVAVVPNGVEVPKPKWAEMQGARRGKRALFVGGLDWYPNADAAEFLVRTVWPHVLERIPVAELHFVGKAPPNWLLERAATEKSIICHGFVEDVRPYYEGAGVFVCPIRDGGGTKLKILHAMAHGVPVVAHPIAIEGLSVVSGRDLLVGETPSEIAACVEKVLADQGLAHQLRTAAWDVIAKEYSVETVGRKLLGSYASLLGPKVQVLA